MLPLPANSAGEWTRLQPAPPEIRVSAALRHRAVWDYWHDGRQQAAEVTANVDLENRTVSVSGVGWLVNVLDRVMLDSDGQRVSAHFRIRCEPEEQPAAPFQVILAECSDEPAAQPALLLPLYERQLRALAWMRRMEAGKSFVMRSDICRRRQEVVLQVVTRRLSTVRGGVLAAEPGWGKTMCALALISGPRPVQEQPRSGLIWSFATLVLVPSCIFKQWVQEAEKFLPGDKKVLYAPDWLAWKKISIEESGASSPPPALSLMGSFFLGRA